ncbi:MAG: radical SAM protein [Bacilli bacterium]|nr:radical SAM protein [Bacilli bacterium]
MRFKKIYIEITNKCNKNCSFCSEDSLPKREMTIDEFKHILKEIKEYTNYIYLHVKGEPLIHSKIEDIIKLCDKYNIKVNLTTNGTYLNKCKEVLSCKIINQINISLQTASDEELKSIIEATEYILKNSRANVVYRFWALKDNQLSKNNLHLLKNIGNFYNQNLIDKESCNYKVKERLYLNKEKQFIWPNEEVLEKKESFCNGLKTHIAILSNGTVVPCCLDSSGNIPLGNIFTESLSNILQKEITINIIQHFKSNKCYSPFCKKCGYRLNMSKMI